MLCHQKGIIAARPITFFLDIRHRYKYVLLLIHNPTIHRFLMPSVEVSQSIFIFNVIEDNIFFWLVAHDTKI
jgi:hypothetical protein